MNIEEVDTDKAKDFAIAWQASCSLKEVEEKLLMPLETIKLYSKLFCTHGVRLKKLDDFNPHMV